ncbi:MAG: hypothetical protein E6R07_13375 [Nevskiaceae bacterium]|nr:MAG: hypothetical protein E6R07_13375 [Nevskiaceae bacterium]
MAWGNSEPEVVVLGFSKGPNQAGALATTPHDQIAYKGGRGNVGRILAHVGLLDPGPVESLARDVDRAIADRNGRFHFSSLIRCTVERHDARSDTWKGSGGSMLDSFLKSEFGYGVATRCAARYLGDLPNSVRLIVLFGLGTNLNYVNATFSLFQIARPGAWKRISDVAYTDEKIYVVHVEHFKSQGSLIPDWLGDTEKPRAVYGRLAREAVQRALERIT